MPYRSEQAKRLCAIRIARDLGLVIQREHPEIVELYRSITPLPTIIRKLDLIDEYNVTEHIARNAVEYALRGYHWGFGAESYKGAIKDEQELREIERKYRIKTGNRLKRRKIGICGQTAEEQREAAILGAEAIGGTRYSRQELDFAYRGFRQGKFFYETGHKKGHPNLQLYADALNKRFHKGKKIRTRASIAGLRKKFMRDKN